MRGVMLEERGVVGDGRGDRRASKWPEDRKWVVVKSLIDLAKTVPEELRRASVVHVRSFVLEWIA